MPWASGVRGNQNRTIGNSYCQERGRVRKREDKIGRKRNREEERGRERKRAKERGREYESI